MSPTENAMRLRQMANYETAIAQSHAETVPDLSDWHQSRAAALLAGAAALEAITPQVVRQCSSWPLDSVFRFSMYQGSCMGRDGQNREAQSSGKICGIRFVKEIPLLGGLSHPPAASSMDGPGTRYPMLRVTLCRRPLHKLGHLHPRRKPDEHQRRLKEHRRFLRELRAWQEAFFAVRSQLNPERLARYAKA